ncbi:hypothetical protein JRO89_XS05G0258700 [Xanthoceras sorbifolium]|uniref:Uncharacterized protein n=1 Tax=Xanthoceras sorbifolium TaxID=99658 RepID=A0ABQ8I3C3_9ROSI|nr:hypothetical protein JRO89_XS05G0258700 [Xanthoceras sorbifolium]
MEVEEETELRRGPWTLEEDTLLSHYISRHGLKRTGKSCRLRWLNYLKPDIKRGNLTPQEQLLILELHSKWGNSFVTSSSSSTPLPSTVIYNSNNLPKEIMNSNSGTNPCVFSSEFVKFCDLKTEIPDHKPVETPVHVINGSGNSAVYNNSNSSNNRNSSSSQIPDDSYSYVGCCGYYDMEGGTGGFNNLGGDPMTEELVVGTYDDMYNLSERQVADGDWLSSDLGDAFWNMDDIWQFRV